MKPVAIFRHAASEGPGYLAGFLDAHQIPWQLIAIDDNEAVPCSSSDYSGLVFMGGPMSVNDPLPWIAQSLALIRDAMDHDIPVLGHCLGGQLMSRAMNGAVSPNPVKEFGWGMVAVTNNDTARDWFGAIQRFEAFHWHGETFSLPQGAAHLLSSPYCINQAYAVGKHLALQCHIEMTAEMIEAWCDIGADEVAANSQGPATQPVADMRRQMADKLPQLQKVAAQLYTKWIAGLPGVPGQVDHAPAAG